MDIKINRSLHNDKPNGNSATRPLHAETQFLIYYLFQQVECTDTTTETFLIFRVMYLTEDLALPIIVPTTCKDRPRPSDRLLGITLTPHITIIRTAARVFSLILRVVTLSPAIITYDALSFVADTCRFDNEDGI